MMRASKASALAVTLLLVAGCSASGDVDDASPPDVEVEQTEGDDEPAPTEDEQPGEVPGTADPAEPDDDPATGDDADGAAPDDAVEDDPDDGGVPDEGADDAAPQVPALHPEIDGFDETVVWITTTDGDVRVDAKVAVEQPERQRGLMEVTDLPGGVGMLFDFGEERAGGFWMKNTLVPLDIAFSADDGEILEILTMEPCEADPCPSYDPGVEYRSALEVPAGWFDQESVAPGDRLRWSEPVASP